MQTLRKKTSPMKYKNETTRFLGDGVCFKAKLIGILEVAEARGDRMCQEALSDLKMAIRAAGEHKQRITVNVAIDGLRLRDEKTGDSLYHHPVHKISFIAQDMTDSRAFGYIFGSPDTGHRFFGIKTDKAASQVVIAMRDLFQVVFALKKKEIELAKQHLEKNYYTSSPLFPDSSKLQSSASPSIPVTAVESTLSSDSKSSRAVNERRGNASGTAVADLVDLELELNSLQQGLNQMEKITPSSADPFGSKDDPFGDSFTIYPPRPILPPPPSSGRERSSRGASESSSMFSPKTPRTAKASTTSDKEKKKDFSFSSDLSSSRDDEGSDWFAVPSAGDNGVAKELSKPSKDEKHERAKREILSQFDVFTELDPLGTGRVRPYIDRKHFFQELKNPPKKALNDLVAGASKDKPLFDTNFDQTGAQKPGDFASDPFGEDPFVEEDPFADSDFSKQDPFETEFANFKKQNANSFHGDLSRSPDKSGYLHANLNSKSPKLDPEKKSTSIFHSRLSADDGEDAPEPPPRPSNQLICIKPPPLPPKKSANEPGIGSARPPPRPSKPEGGSSSPYEFLGTCESTPVASEDSGGGPPLPAPYRKWKFEGSGPGRPEKTVEIDDGYLTPVEVAKSAGSSEGLLNGSIPSISASDKANTTTELEGLDITLSQLTLTGLSELARKLNVPAAQLSNMTLVQLTEFLSNLIRSSSTKRPPAAHTDSSRPHNDLFADFADFKADFDSTESRSDASYDRYAVFRELMREEIGRNRAETVEEAPEPVVDEKPVDPDAKPSNVDRYAALREIVENELKQSEEEPAGVDEPDGKEEVVEEDSRDIEEKLNIINQEKQQLRSDENDDEQEKKIIEYISLAEHKVLDIGEKKPQANPVKSNIIKSPVPNVITEIVQNNARLTSGSLSDVISGSSPEIDNTASNSELGKKINDVTGESWAIFDRETVRSDPSKDKRPVQSEEGASPWSSDSKEFGASSPPEWRSKDSGSGTDPLPRTRRRDRDGWWETNPAEPDGRYCPANRRSTDSYDEEYYECYDRPRRRRMPSSWQHGGGGGGHSSSSRDVSPWEEEPRRRELREHSRGSAYRHASGVRSFDRRRDRRLTDSWDEDEDYEYEDDHLSRHRSERHVPRETDRDGRHSTGSRDRDLDRWREDRSDDRRHKRRREGRDRRCCPDWEQTEHDKIRYGSARWRDREPDERYYSKDSQESPWEDEYSNDADESPRFVSCATKRNWKQRPSSASEMDRKTGEIKSRHHPAPGGSDGERDRHHKSTRRSRSRDSQYSEPPSGTTSSLHRRKPETATSPRHPHRLKTHAHFRTTDDDVEKAPLAAPSAIRKPEATSTFPRRATAGNRSRSAFENDFVAPQQAERAEAVAVKVNFESDSDKSSPLERPRPVVSKATSPRYHQKPKSHRFEDDFSPGDKPHEDSISSIKEEEVDRDEDLEEEDNDEFAVDRFESVSNGARKPSTRTRRFSSNLRPSADAGVRKSESVDIFAREDDPFDDDFFCGGGGVAGAASAVRCTELRWTDDYSND